MLQFLVTASTFYVKISGNRFDLIYIVWGLFSTSETWDFFYCLDYMVLTCICVRVCVCVNQL